ncbi:glutamate carboxypeptidase 2-like [Styela clava]
MRTSSAITSAFGLGAAMGLGITVIYLQLVVDKDNGNGHGSSVEIDKVRKIIMEQMNTTKLEENLRRLASKPHIAGREVDEVELVGFISDSWNSSGLDVKIHKYDVLLSYPSDTDPNYVAIRTSDGRETVKSALEDKILDQSQNVSGVVNAYSAYAPAGDPEGDLVYVNFGSIEDFTELNETFGIDVKGKICIARIGGTGKAKKAKHAAEFGCLGLIMYTDPKEFTVAGKGVYPDDWFLPGSAAQRGSLRLQSGDPLTPKYPSIDTAWREDVSNTDLPTIPVTPIGYDDARKYLSRMAGPEVPTKWKGGLNITYRLGPGFSGKYDTSKMRMHVANRNEMKTVHNVIGYIRGAVEPDRYVILGNHRDAWAFGTLDPSSGTAVMVELARVLGEAVKTGWRPRRTIIFCSWGAEEFALVGSQEWVEEYQKILSDRTVAYLNVDSSVVGIYSMYAASSPNLRQAVFDAAKKIPNPNKAEAAVGLKTLYDAWRIKLPANLFDPNTLPTVLLPGVGSDYASFLHLTGISVVDMAYVWDVRLGLEFYPVYHTVYETLDLMTTFLDPDFVYHQAIGRLWGELTLSLAESALVPMNCVDYAEQVKSSAAAFLNYKSFQKDMEANGINTTLLKSAVEELTNEAKHFHERLKKVDLKNPLAVRAANDQLVLLERSFIDIQGIDGIREKHVIYSPGQYFSNLQFPGLADSLYNIDKDQNQQMRWNEVKKQYSIILYHLGSAASILRDFTPIIGASAVM